MYKTSYPFCALIIMINMLCRLPHTNVWTLWLPTTAQCASHKGSTTRFQIAIEHRCWQTVVPEAHLLFHDAKKVPSAKPALRAKLSTPDGTCTIWTLCTCQVSATAIKESHHISCTPQSLGSHASHTCAPAQNTWCHIHLGSMTHSTWRNEP